MPLHTTAYTHWNKWTFHPCILRELFCILWTLLRCNFCSILCCPVLCHLGFPNSSEGKNSPASAGAVRNMESILGSRRFPGGGNGNPLQCSCWDNPMDRDAWRAIVNGVTKSKTWLSDWAFMHTPCHFNGMLTGVRANILLIFLSQVSCWLDQNDVKKIFFNWSIVYL